VNIDEITRFVRCEEARGGARSAGGIPFDFGGATVLYNVILPRGTRAQLIPSFKESCSAFYGFHLATVSRFLRGARPILYTVIPADCVDLSDSGFLPLVSHELAEAVTDPFPGLYWWDNSTSPLAFLDKGESADICSAHHAHLAQTAFRAVPFGFGDVAAYWSNADHACVVGTKRVVYSEFPARGPNGPYRLTVNGQSRPLGYSRALAEGTPFAFSSNDPGPGRRHVFSGECSGVVSFPPEGNETADASHTYGCFAQLQDRVQFEATGLPAGAPWQVFFDGVAHDGPTSTWVNDGTALAFAFGDAGSCTFTGASAASPLTVDTPVTILGGYACGPPPLPNCSTYRDAVLWSHPAGYWRLGDNGYVAHDEGPFGLDGYIEWGDEPGIAEGIPGALVGDPDTAMNVNGNGIRMPDVPALDFVGNAASVEIWARGAFQSPYGYLVSKSDWGGTVGYSLYTGPSNTLRFFVGTGSQQITQDTGFTWDSNWHHIVGVYDGSSVKLYVDDALLADTPATGSIVSSAGMQLVVARFHNGGFPFRGDIDEVAVYDHALTAGEVETHYAVGTGGWPCA
jgi:hypothetical protein